MTIPRSSTEELGGRHCPAAPRHQELGTPRDQAGMAVGVAVHHMIHAVASRDDGVTADVAIDACASSLISDGRRFESGPVEYLSSGHVDTARDHTLEFLDRDMIPERDDADWMEAELSVAVDRAWKRVDRDMCRCGHAGDHPAASTAGDLSCTAPGCDCGEFRPAAIWQQTVDLAVIYRDEIDDEEVVVVEITDWKGGNCSKAWFTSLQGKGAVGIAPVLCPEVDIIRRRPTSYMPWGGRYEDDLDLRTQEGADMLEDCRRAIEVASAGARARQGRTPDELALPGAGCSAGFGGCPWLLQCSPFTKQWGVVAMAWAGRRENPFSPLLAPVGGDAQTWASMYALAKAVQQEAASRVKVALVDTDSVATVDGKSVVGWKPKKKQKVAANAAMLLSREWVESILGLEKGSVEAQLQQAQLEAVLMNAFPRAGGSGVVQRIAKRLGEVIGWQAAEVLLGQCLEDDTGRMLATWKAAPPLADLLAESVEARKLENLLDRHLGAEGGVPDPPAVPPVGWRQWRADQLKGFVAEHGIELGEPTGKTSPQRSGFEVARRVKADYVTAISRWLKEGQGNATATKET